MARQVDEREAAVLQGLSENTGPVEIRQLADQIGLDQSLVTVAVQDLAEQVLVTIDETEVEEFRLGKLGRELAEHGFPERAIIKALAAQDSGAASIAQTSELSGLPAKEVGKSIRWLTKKGWADRNGGDLQLTDAGRAATDSTGPDEALVALLAEHGDADLAALESHSIDVPAARDLLKDRKGAVDVKVRRLREVALTDDGRAALKEGLDVRRTVNLLTTEMMLDGSWKNVQFRPYDVTLESAAAVPGKPHPMQRVIEKTRRVFLEMGFREVDHAFVESAFWDFDALFQPQDHPARDMQDTFYLQNPGECRLPDEELVQRIAATHETGGDTGSRGWQYKWNADMARQAVLRTHTTAASIREIQADPGAPQKVFCIGPVFRRETIDYKHLPVFHQVDGIIVDENASFAALLGTLAAFYEKMGFPKVQFRPSFFPYTEPSLEVFVWMEQRQDWVEMGGAGMFRPEVVEPIGCTAPVLAWGLGLERLAMMHYGCNDIRDLYISKMSWLEEMPLCR